MSGFFYNLGRHVGRKAVPTLRKTKYIWEGVAGTEEEAFNAELKLGAEMAAELRGAFAMARDTETERRLNELCEQLRVDVKDKRRVFRCEIFCDPTPNAIALPGGNLFLSDSLLELCERNRDEVAFALGHEMAHVVLGHAWDRIFNETMLRAAALATSRAGQLGAWLHQQGFALLRSAHSRDQEFAADELGFRLAQAAGFGGGAAALLRRLANLGPEPGAMGQYLASHPSAAERMARLRAISSPSAR